MPDFVPAATTTTPATESTAQNPDTGRQVDPKASDAGRTLAQSRADRMARLEPAPAAAKPDPAAEAAAAETSETNKLLGYIRDSRKLAADRRAVESSKAEATAAQALAPLLVEAKKLMDAGDVAGALEALKLDKDRLYKGPGSLFFQLADKIKRMESGEPEPVDVGKTVAEKVAEELKKRDDATAEQNRKDQEAADQRRETMLHQVSAQTNAEVAKVMHEKIEEFPYVEINGGIPDEAVSNPYYVGGATLEMLKNQPKVLESYCKGFADKFEKRHGARPSQAQVQSWLDSRTTPGFAERFEDANGGKRPDAVTILKYFNGVYEQDHNARTGKLAMRKPKPAPAMATGEDTTLPNTRFRSAEASPGASKEDRSNMSADQLRELRMAALGD